MTENIFLHQFYYYFISGFRIFRIYILYLHKNNQTMEYSEEQLKKAERYTNTAISVFSFLQNLPSPLGEFVFKRIVEDAYKVAEIIPAKEAIQQLIESICNSIETSRNLSQVYECLEVIKYQKEIDAMEKEQLREFLLEEYRSKELPNASALVLAYSCFSPASVDDEYIENLKASVRSRMLPLTKAKFKNNILYKNAFQELGYKTFFLNWIYGELPDFDELFFNWYCKGEILHSILDTAFNCEVSIISRSLMQHIQKECRNNYLLCNAFQNVYNSYKECTLVPVVTFKSGKDMEDEYQSPILALPRIQVDGTNVSEICLFNLYDHLHKRGDIHCSFEEFTAVFSGRDSIAQPIKWYSSASKLAAFLLVVRGAGKANKEYSFWAEKLFIQKSGKNAKANTLNQPKYDAQIEYKNIFNKAGIKR